MIFSANTAIIMKYVVDQMGRFWHWVQQGGNSNIVLVAITAWYSWLTLRMLKWGTAQAREQLRPNLVLTISRSRTDPTEGHFAIENVGERHVNILDAVVTSFVEGARFSKVHPDDVQGAILPPKQKLSGSFPIPPRFDEWVICTFRVASSDIGCRVFRTYEYWSNIHKMLVSEHRPARVAVRMWTAPVRVWCFKAHRWAQHSLTRKLLLAAIALVVLAILASACCCCKIDDFSATQM